MGSIITNSKAVSYIINYDDLLRVATRSYSANVMCIAQRLQRKIDAVDIVTVNKYFCVLFSW